MQNYECPNPVFSRVWGGTERGCYEDRWIRDDYIRTYEEYRRSNDENDYCDDIYAVPGRIQTQFLGKYFCGVPGGQAFHAVTRVDPDTEKCPEGTTPCSPATSPVNTVCYPED